MIEKTNLIEASMVLYDRLNRPMHDLRLSVIDRCNLRCPYCMPQESKSHQYHFLKPQEWLSFEQISKLIHVFVGLGVKKLRITGGEPLLRPNLPDLIRQLKLIYGLEEIALTTNGILLASMAEDLKLAGLDRLTVSLDSLDEDVYRKMTGTRGQLKDVLKGIEVAQHAGFESLKINCVVQRGVNDHTVLEMVKHFKATAHILRFIEYMDVGNQNHWNYSKVVPSSELIKQINNKFPLRLLERNYSAETSERYGFLDSQGEIGFVSSVTKAFCGDCNRLRLSADGKMYTCLFSSKGVDIKGTISEKSDHQELINLITSTWNKRSDRYSQLRSSLRQKESIASKVEMFQVGG